jgi:hypothetical protein
MDQYLMRTQALREAVAEMLYTWETEHPLLPDASLETEEDIGNATVHKGLILSVVDAARQAKPSVLIEKASALIEHYRSIEKTNIWVGTREEAPHTNYARSMTAIEHYIKSILNLQPKTQ